MGERVRTSGGSPLGPGRQSRTPQAQFDQAHAAIAGDRQPFVIAKARNFRAGGLAGLEQRVLQRNVDFLVVDDQFGH
jgi:hypothetical protein